jgi:RES domain-containing protein
MIAYRLAKAKYPPFDGTGAMLVGGRWNSPGRAVVYCADSYAGAVLEIIAHAAPRRLPGAHHCARVSIPDELVEVLDESALPGWDAPDLIVSRRFGDSWLDQGRSAALSVPSATGRPFGRNVIVNPAHSDAHRINVEPPVPVTWDPRLFGI